MLRISCNNGCYEIVFHCIIKEKRRRRRRQRHQCVEFTCGKIVHYYRLANNRIIIIESKSTKNIITCTLCTAMHCTAL